MHTQTLRSCFLGALLSALILPAFPCEGQAAPYILIAESVVANPGSTAETSVVLDSSQGNSVGSVSFGVCFDSAVITAQSIAQGVDMAALQGGTGPDFFATNFGPNFYTLGCVVDFLGMASIPPSPSFELTRTTFSSSTVPGSSALAFCLAGVPPIAISIGVAGTPGTVSPTTVDGTFLLGAVAGALGLSIQTPPVMGSSFDATVTLDSSNAFEGFRFGVGHDSADLTLVSATENATLAALNGGAGPDQFLVDLNPVLGTGFTVDCVFSTLLTSQLPAGLHSLVDVVYNASVLPAGCATTVIMFRDDLGVPIEVDLPTSTGLAVGPNVSIAITAAPPPPPTGGVYLRVGTVAGIPGSTAVVPVLLDSDLPVQAFSFSASHSSSEYVLTSIDPGLALLSIGCTVGPSFFDSSIPFGGTQFGSVIAIVDADLAAPLYVLPVGSQLEIVRLSFQIPAAPSSNNLNVTLEGGLGNPPVALEVSADFLALTPVVTPGGVGMAGAFERADCNSDGARNIADAIALLGHLFPGVNPITITCEDACDGNDDGGLNIADAIFVLNSLFGSQTLPEPINCGDDPTPGDSLGCDVSGGC